MGSAISYDVAQEYEVLTEHRDGNSQFDILLRPISGDDGAIVLENKIKSFGHPAQLEKYTSQGYEVMIVALLPETIDRGLDEYPLITYSVVRELLDERSLDPTNGYHFVIREYRDYLDRTLSSYDSLRAFARGQISHSAFAHQLRSALLRGLGHQPPYVLFGHSFGGLLSRAFFYEYPDEVAGLVLVNDTDERLFKALQAVHPSWAPLPAPRDDEARLAEVAMLRQVQDAGSLPDSRPLAGMPVYILTRGRSSGAFPSDSRGLRVVRGLHADLFSGVTDGAHIVAARSNHLIHVVEPELVAWSIRQVVDASRSTGNE